VSSGRRAGAGLVVAALALVAAASPSPAQVQDPTVTLDRTGTAAGEDLGVVGAGWPAGATLLVELCGQGGLGGSTDCDVGRQRTAGVAPNGMFSATLRVGTPPSPCPCVVKVTDQTSRVTATAGIAVAGIPTVPIEESDAPLRRIEITSLDVRGGSWTELLGTSSDRELDITLTNTGEVAIDRPAIAVAWGRGSSPTGLVEAPAVGRLAPGASQTVTVELPRGALAWGRFAAVVEVQGLGAPVRAKATSSIYPWALLALVLVALQLLLLRVRNRLRRRFHPPTAGRAPVSVPPAPPVDARPLLLSIPAPAADPPGAARSQGRVVLGDGGAGRDVAAVSAGEPLEGDIAAATPDASSEREERNEIVSGGRERTSDDLANTVVAWATDGERAAPGLEALLAEHRASVAAVEHELLRSFERSAARIAVELGGLRLQATRAISQVAAASDALVARAVAAAAQGRVAAAAHERRTQERLAEAETLLRAAQARAAALVETAESAAQHLLRVAADSGPAPAGLPPARDERAGLPAQSLGRMEQEIDGPERRADHLDRRVVADVRDARTIDLDDAPPPVRPKDELDRRLADALVRALRS